LPKNTGSSSYSNTREKTTGLSAFYWERLGKACQPRTDRAILREPNFWQTSRRSSTLTAGSGSGPWPRPRGLEEVRQLPGSGDPEGHRQPRQSRPSQTQPPRPSLRRHWGLRGRPLPWSPARPRHSTSIRAWSIPPFTILNHSHLLRWSPTVPPVSSSKTRPFETSAISVLLGEAWKSLPAEDRQG